MRAIFHGRPGVHWQGMDKLPVQPRHPFFIRIKDNRLVQWGKGQKNLRDFLIHLGDGHERTLYKEIDERNLVIVSKKIKDDFLVVCSNASNPESVLPTYKTRWSIERCFKDMKSQGFNLENTHMICKERLKKLMAIVAVAMLWSSLAGNLVASPFKKTVRSPLYSTFTRGLRWVKNNLYNPCFTDTLNVALKSEG